MAQPLHVQADMLKLIKDNDSVLGVGHVNKSVLCKKVGFHVCLFFSILDIIFQRFANTESVMLSVM